MNNFSGFREVETAPRCLVAGPGVMAKAVMTEYHSLGGYKQRKFISHSSGSRTSEIRVPAQLGSNESPLLGCRFLLCSYVAERRPGSSLGSLF